MVSFEIISHSLSSLILEILLNVVISATPVVVLVYFLAKLFQKASSAFHHLLWTFTIFSFVVIPFFALYVPPFNIDSFLANEYLSFFKTGLSSFIYLLSSQIWSQNIVLVWLFVFTGLLLRLLYDVCYYQYFIPKKATKFSSPEKISSRVRKLHEIKNIQIKLHSNKNIYPYTAGIRKPLIILPEQVNSWSKEKLSMVIAHEIAHIDRKDNIINILTYVIGAIFWFNPLVWPVLKKIKIEQEKACDDEVINLGFSKSSYADVITDLVLKNNQSYFSGLTISSIGNKFTFVSRLESIIDDSDFKNRNYPNLKTILKLAGIFVSISLILSVIKIFNIKPITDDSHNYYYGSAINPLRYNVFIDKWRIIGPFPRVEDIKYGLTENYLGKPDERLSHLPLSVNYKGVTYHSRILGKPVINLDKFFSPNDDIDTAVAYCQAIIESASEQSVTIAIGVDDCCQVYLNNKLIAERIGLNPLHLDHNKIKATLKKGYNNLLIKVAEDHGEWGVIARIIPANSEKPLIKFKWQINVGYGSIFELPEIHIEFLDKEEKLIEQHFVSSHRSEEGSDNAVAALYVDLPAVIPHWVRYTISGDESYNNRQNKISWNEAYQSEIKIFNNAKIVMRGRVLTTDELPGEGVNVLAYNPRDFSYPINSSITDENGYFEILLPEGFYFLNTISEGYYQTSEIHIELFKSIRNDNLPVIEIKKGHSIHGRISDSKTKIPITEAIILMENGTHTMSDNNGTFLLDGVYPGHHTMSVWKKGYKRNNIDPFEVKKTNTSMEINIDLTRQ